MARKNHLIVDSGCTQDNERWSLSACGLNEDSEVSWDGTHKREFVSCKRCQAKMTKPRPAPEPFHKERPILFSGAMVRAILSGQKTVTRRLVKGNQIPSRSKSDSPEHQWIAVVQDHPRWGFAAFGATEQECAAELAMYGGCPYGRPGDRLWVRESLGYDCEYGHYFAAGGSHGETVYLCSLFDNEEAQTGPSYDGLLPERSVPSIHLHRRYSRILLEITDVRVERLQDISPKQITDEGVSTKGEAMWGRKWWDDAPDQAIEDARNDFASLWNSVGGDWDANPWVWCVSFKRVTP